MHWALWNVTRQHFYSNGLNIELYDEPTAFCKACFFSMPSGALSCHVWRAVRWDTEAQDRARESGQLAEHDWIVGTPLNTHQPQVIITTVYTI